MAAVLAFNSQAVLAAEASLQTADSAHAQSLAGSFTEAERTAIEGIVHDYLVNHPEVMYEVMAKLEQDQRNKAQALLEETAEMLRTDKLTPSRGSAGAKHYLIEFYDYNCGYCKVVRELTEKLASEHQMQAVYIEFPILSPESVQAAMAGLALYQLQPEKYFLYQKDLMEQGKKVTSIDDIKAAVERAGADWEAVREKAQSPEVQQQLKHNLEIGQRLGITGTPFFIIDGKVLRGAVRDYAALEGMLEP